MIPLKHLWLWTAFTLTFILLLLALAIWQSQRPATVQPPIVFMETQPKVVAASYSDIPAPQIVDATYPAPAKKLHKLMTDPDFKPVSDITLEQKLQVIDQHLARLDEQLQLQGFIRRPEHKSQPDVTLSDTAQRIQAIREHMQAKEAAR